MIQSLTSGTAEGKIERPSRYSRLERTNRSQRRERQ